MRDHASQGGATPPNGEPLARDETLHLRTNKRCRKTKLDASSYSVRCPTFSVPWSMEEKLTSDGVPRNVSNTFWREVQGFC